jgi:hypothetical protein
MAHGERAEILGHRSQGKEYWKSRLHKHGKPPGKYTKKRTHKKERRNNKREFKE